MAQILDLFKRPDSCCKMTVRLADGTLITVIRRGDYWDLLADAYERENPGCKVIRLEGCE